MTSTTSIGDIDVDSYLASIEETIRREGDTIARPLSDQNRKPMIRTLLGLDDKVEFERILRNTRTKVDFERMASFAKHILYPRLVGNVLDKVPHLPTVIDTLVAQKPLSGKGAAVFARLASGKRYRGNVHAMLEDIAPEIIPMYEEAVTPSSKDDILLSVIDSCEVDDERKHAAVRCVHIAFPCSTKKGAPLSSGKENGLYCERACMSYLNGKCHGQPGKIVLQNVLILNKLKSSKTGECNASKSGKLVTSLPLDKVCAEFDAVVVDHADAEVTTDDGGHVTEIWEAKFTLSPNTIHDAITKKIASFRAIMEDDSAILSYNGRKSATIKRNIDHDSLHTFGIICVEVLPIAQAAGQLKILAVANALRGNVDAVLRALESEVVEIETDRVVQDVVKIRSILNEIHDFRVICKLANFDSKEENVSIKNMAIRGGRL